MQAVADAEVAVVEAATPIPSLLTAVNTAATVVAEDGGQKMKDWLDGMSGPGGSFENFSRVSKEVFGDNLVATMASGGGLGAEAFDLSFMTGPGGVSQTIPQGMMKIAADGSWNLTGGQGGEGFLGGLTDVLGGEAGGIKGFFHETLGGVSGILSQFTNGDWKSTLSTMVSMGLNTLVPGLGTIANQAFAAFKQVFDWFKKPSETEIAARETWASIESTVVDTLRGTQEFSNEVDRAMADGWDQSTAEMRAAFVLLGQQAGQTYDESFESYAAYEQAVRDGDVELAEQMMASLQSLAEEHGTTWATNVDTTSAATSAIQGSINAVVGKDVAINVRHHTTYTSSGSSAAPSGGKKHTGGPVSAGVSYETIPGEVFVPRTDGTVINPGLIDYERLGAAVARAVAASPPTIAQNPVTDAILRNMPRREALRGWAPA